MFYINNRTGEKTKIFDIALNWFKNGDEVDVIKQVSFGNGVYFNHRTTTFTIKTHSHLLNSGI